MSTSKAFRTTHPNTRCILLHIINNHSHSGAEKETIPRRITFPLALSFARNSSTLTYPSKSWNANTVWPFHFLGMIQALWIKLFLWTDLCKCTVRPQTKERNRFSSAYVCGWPKPPRGRKTHRHEEDPNKGKQRRCWKGMKKQNKMLVWVAFVYGKSSWHGKASFFFMLIRCFLPWGQIANAEDTQYYRHILDFLTS